MPTGCLPPRLFDEASQLVHIHVAFERMRVHGVKGFIDDQIGRPPTTRPDVGVGGVEVHVRRDVLPRLDEHRAEDVLGCASLVRGDEILEAKNISTV
jgi:hypothetical protein